MMTYEQAKRQVLRETVTYYTGQVLGAEFRYGFEERLHAVDIHDSNGFVVFRCSILEGLDAIPRQAGV